MTRFTTEERDDLKVWARIHVRGGYEPVEEIEEILLDLTEEFESPISERDRQSEIRSGNRGRAVRAGQVASADRLRPSGTRLRHAG